MGDKEREAAKDARQQTVAEKMMPSRGLLRLVIMMFINLVFCLVSLVIIAAGIWSTPHGRNALHKVAVQINGGLVAVPPAERGSVWRMKKLLHKLTLEMPGFLVGYHGDRAAMYADAEVISRDHPVAFRDGFAVFSHKSVAGVLTSADQPRGMYLGASPVPDKCMGNDTLIFMGTGTEHTQVREFLLSNVPAWKNVDPVHGSLDLDFGEDEELVNTFRSKDGVCQSMPVGTDLEGLLLRSLVRTMFKTMFEAPLRKEALDAYVAYSKWGGTCVLGTDFHKLTGGLILNKVDDLRKQIRQAILETPGGQRIKKAAAAAAAAGTLPNRHDEDASGDSIIRQLADGSAFAGMLGTFHLTSHALRRLQSNPRTYLPLWEADPAAFLHEEARVDPPVTSVTAVLGNDAEVHIVDQGSTHFEKGTPYQLIISTANTDTNIFGGDRKSKRYAYAFDIARAHADMLSWNGRLEDVQKFKAPRGCPGYRLSMALAKALVTTFRPAPDSLPRPLAPGSTASKFRPSMDPASEAGLWTAKGGGGPIDPKIGYKAGCGVWLVCCLIGMGWLLGQGLGAISTRYFAYLCAQAVLAVGVIMELPGISLQGMLFGAMAYYLMYITAVSQRRKLRGHLLSMWVWFVWSILAVVLALVSAFFGYTENMQVVAMLFYSVGAMLGVLTIYRFYVIASVDHKLHNNTVSKERYDAAVCGLVGAFFGTTNLVFALYPGWGLFLSRVLDSVLYVPFMLRCVKAMDKDFLDTDVVLPNGWCIRTAMAIFSTLFAIVFGLSCFGLASAVTDDLCVWEPKASMPADLSICTSTPMSKVDAYGLMMYTMVKFMVQKTEGEVILAEDPKSIKLPKYSSILQQKEAIVGTGWNIPIEDEDTEEEGLLKKSIKYFVMDVLIRSTLLWPFHDNPQIWTNLEQARSIMKVAGGNFLPRPVMDWNNIDKTSDEAVSAMCFAGMAAPRVVRLPDDKDTDAAAFVVDFSGLVTLDVRAGFGRYGATAFFDAKQKLVRIRWSEHALDVRPGDKHWNHAKWVFKCSALLGITAVEHLMNLPKNHPIRRLIKPFSHGTPTVNLGAQLFLTTENGLLHRTMALDWSGLRTCLVHGLQTVRVAANPMDKHKKALAELGDLDFPYAADGRDFYKVVLTMVDRYFRVYYASDQKLRDDPDLARFYYAVRVFKDTSLPQWGEVTISTLSAYAASFIFHVAGMHHVVGNVAEYLMHPDFASIRIRPGSEVADVEASHYGLLVAILTGLKTPKLVNDFSHLLLQDKHIIETSKIFDDFQADLVALGKKIDERNTKRKWKFDGFHPSRLLSSVSI